MTPPIRAAILTISDKGSRGERQDTAGPAIAELLRSIDAYVELRDVVADERAAIAARLRDWADRGGIDVIITTGGTGLAARDVTPEATLDVGDRIVPGVSEAMRAEGLAHTPFAMLTRGVSVVRGSTLIVNLPGSEQAVRENMAVLLPVLEHAVMLLRGHTEHKSNAT